jgi:N-acetylglucosamine-6-phosphate deacetylase
MRLAYRCLGHRLCAVSDASLGTGLPEGTLFGPGQERIVKDNVGMLIDGTSFAGSTSLLNQMIPVLINDVGLTVPEAFAMVTATPARITGIDAAKGTLEAGKDADLVVFNSDFGVWRTMIGGRWY